jgi:hypothetical protein
MLFHGKNIHFSKSQIIGVARYIFTKLPHSLKRFRLGFHYGIPQSGPKCFRITSGSTGEVFLITTPSFAFLLQT